VSVLRFELIENLSPKLYQLIIFFRQ